MKDQKIVFVSLLYIFYYLHSSSLFVKRVFANRTLSIGKYFNLKIVLILLWVVRLEGILEYINLTTKE